MKNPQESDQMGQKDAPQPSSHAPFRAPTMSWRQLWDPGSLGSAISGICDLWDVRVELQTDYDRSTKLLGVIYLEAAVTGANLPNITQNSIKPRC